MTVGSQWKKRNIEGFRDTFSPQSNRLDRKSLKRTLKIVVRMLRCSSSRSRVSGRVMGEERVRFFFFFYGAGYWKFAHAPVSICNTHWTCVFFLQF
jgi:hypothetical protein